MPSPTPKQSPAPRRTTKTFPMSEDTVLGDGGNVTVYERPDSSQYALDKRGGGSEWTAGSPIFGRARFDDRELSTGRWPGSRSKPETPPDTSANSNPRARRRGSRFRTG